MVHPPIEKSSPHALVIGGTGMLRSVSLHLAESGYAVSVIARSKERLDSLAAAASTSRGAIHPLPLDYRQSERLVTALRTAMERNGPVELAVCWIHSVAPDALRLTVETLASNSTSCRLFHVRGSAVANPASAGPRAPEWIQEYPGVRYRQVILGFVVEGGRSRWLTHDEISGGVISAIAGDAAYSIVGTVEPWSMRP